MEITRTVGFDTPDQRATRIVREMYGHDHATALGQPFWLIEEDDDEAMQIAAKIGPPNCEPECAVAVLFHADGQWLEVWRRPGEVLRVGRRNEMTGLRNLVDEEREWVWTGERYHPYPRGEWPMFREATEAEAVAARAYVFDNTGIEPNPYVAAQGTIALSIDEGEGKAVRVGGGGACGTSDACPVVMFDADGEPIGMVKADNGDVRLGEGRDANGYRRVEVARQEGVAIASPSSKTAYGLIGPEEVTRAGGARTNDPLDPADGGAAR